jgi:hypothetical protein
MRWFRVREARVDTKLREMFEQYGPGAAQMVLATGHYFRNAKEVMRADAVLDSLLPWLTEQYDRAERKETWLITMEVAITVFVLAELVLGAVSFARTGCQ